MCNCMEEKIEIMLDTASSKISSLSKWEVKHACFKHTTESFCNILNIPVIISGLNGKGNKAKKELYYPVIYCPFCGVKYE